MIRKFAVALIATTMLVAPALAADAVKSSPMAPVTAATTTAAAPAATAAPAVTPASKDATKTVIKTATKTEHRKTIKVAHRNGHHLMVAKSHQPASHAKTVKVSKPVKTVMARPAASPVTLFPWTAPKTEPVKTVHAKTEHHKTVKVAHRQVHHLMVAQNHKPSHVKSAKVTKPAIKTATSAVSTATPAASKPAVKVIKADRDIKKLKVANRHGHHLTVAKNHKPASLVKTAKVSKPGKHADLVKTQGQVAHDVKGNKVIAN
jgi:hypothetical protein